jgi:phosphatidate cytidylyltransferase
MNNFWQRAMTGTVFVGVIVAATIFNQLSFLCLLLLIGFGGLYEFYSIVFRKQPRLMEIIFLLLGGLIIVSYDFFHWDLMWLFGTGLVFATTAISVLLSREKDWKRVAYYITGLLYVAVPLSLFYYSSFHIVNSYIVYDYFLPLNLFILIWSSDTFAYICGRAFGKRKLFESISPKKTWEGFIGGAVLTIGISFLLAWMWNIPYELNIAVAICTVVFGTLGDLVESMLKREFNVKDSGSILPGHGGMLDRFDALLISLPFTTFCYYIYWH